MYLFPPSTSTCAVTLLCPRGKKDQDGQEAEPKLSQSLLVPFDPCERCCSWAGIYLFSSYLCSQCNRFSSSAPDQQLRALRKVTSEIQQFKTIQCKPPRKVADGEVPSHPTYIVHPNPPASTQSSSQGHFGAVNSHSLESLSPHTHPAAPLMLAHPNTILHCATLVLLQIRPLLPGMALPQSHPPPRPALPLKTQTKHQL